MELITEIIDKISGNSSEQSSEISDVISQELSNILGIMMENGDDINAAMISSVDGIAWAKKISDDFDQHRFAAMSSALVALSDNIAQEGQKGETLNILIEGASGNIFIMHAGSNLLLTVFTKGESNLGISLAYAKQATQNIESLVITA